ncbi:hypothetical protein PoB_005492300 [Plakobranchus ocellatus]|uniref:Uncharacterized protein n=1 Tax=Plakobranchus ocellatus TaxID=259542 RepID=A0AAV4C945_9GAST|nr:hypothetical protein PoB_005492300 [Plakobranchus ocellatus]
MKSKISIVNDEKAGETECERKRFKKRGGRKRGESGGIEKRTSSQQGDFRLSGPPSGQGAGGEARTRDRRVSADLREDLLSTLPPTPHTREQVQ